MLAHCKFFLYQAWFGFKEEWSNFSNGLFGFLMYPIFVLILSLVWLKYRTFQLGFSYEDLLHYVGLTELIVMTSLNSLPSSQAIGDFSFSLSRPKPWYLCFSALVLGRNLAKRLIYLGVFIFTLCILNQNAFKTFQYSLGFLQVLPFLVLLEIFMNMLWVILMLLFGNLAYFRFLVIKILLLCGGVFTPLNELGQPWQEILLKMPMSKIVFQPAYFALRGHFFNLSVVDWLTQVFWFLLLLGFVTLAVFKLARNQQQNFGG